MSRRIMLLIASTSVLLPFPFHRERPNLVVSLLLRCFRCSGNRIRDACSASCSLACRVIGTPNNGSFRPGSPAGLDQMCICVCVCVLARACTLGKRGGQREQEETDGCGGCLVFHVSEDWRENSTVCCTDGKRTEREGGGENRIEIYICLFIHAEFPGLRARANVYSRA